MTVSEGTAIEITEHALWRFAERGKRSASDAEIEQMIRAGLAAKRVATTRAYRPLIPNENGKYDLGPRRKRLFVWNEAADIVFVLFAEDDRFVVKTVLT